ncbi:hypothetical protein CVT25_009393 [Psilocybe cyanescens]|uniref:Uncharacterized protein n=1 Tax=Psilocybe cyanescens TaxID=93625 RepID=A0A409XV04_PSICY|nr:hypothetical protein CVT25_009393 [Psilocybe cyanescens]
MGQTEGSATGGKTREKGLEHTVRSGGIAQGGAKVGVNQGAPGAGIRQGLGTDKRSGRKIEKLAAIPVLVPAPV